MGDSETRAVDKDALREGVSLEAGHGVVLVVADLLRGGASRGPGSAAGAGSDGGEEPAAAAEDGPAATAGKLKNPRWGKEVHGPAETAELAVDVEGEDGGIVLFLVECLQGGAWVRATELRATVSDGAARATLRLEHPGRADPGGGARRAHYRFSARLG